MALKTDLNKVKAIASGTEGIECLNDTDKLVKQVFDLVAVQVSESAFGNFCEQAQTYLAAHYLSLAFNSANADGKLSSQSIGGISETYTLPYLTTKSILGSTQYGMQYMEIRNSCVAGVRMIQPSS